MTVFYLDTQSVPKKNKVPTTASTHVCGGCLLQFYQLSGPQPDYAPRLSSEGVMLGSQSLDLCIIVLPRLNTFWPPHEGDSCR